MARSAKTISIRHLHSAVKTALEAAKTKHPEFKLESLGDSGSSGILPIYYRFPWICGLPPFPWPDPEIGNITNFAKTFTDTLASNRQITAAGVDGKFEPVVQVSGGNVAVGFTPGDVSFTE
jgi:hypothetical protein